MSEHTPSNPGPLNDDSSSQLTTGLPLNAAADDHRREELDDLIWKAQELVRNLDTLSIASEVGEEDTRTR